MYAAVVESFDRSPRYTTFQEPEPQEGELLVQVQASALSNLVKGQASGKHYSKKAAIPFIPGNDGVGLLPDGRRVYFLSPRAPFGAMAEWSVVPAERMIPLPESITDMDAAALANPGMATWGALIGRARFEKGEAVLVNGATGVAGQQAIQAAKFLGARLVIATGRDSSQLERLKELGADEVISLEQGDDALEQSFRRVLHKGGVNVVLDYLWGRSAVLILKAAAGHGELNGEPRVRFIQIGSISGDNIPFAAGALRSSGVELLGSGLGSLPIERIMDSLRIMYASADAAGLKINVDAVPLREVETHWDKMQSGRRLVFVP
jgi:NADPH:quinone reductase-like Zn-dependent oxidoreductase